MIDLRLRSARLGLLAGPVLAFCCVACVDLHSSDDSVTDGKLTAKFKRERTEFDSLATMLDVDRPPQFLNGYKLALDADGMDSYCDALSLPRIPGERWNTYGRLLRRIAFGRHVWADSEHVVLQQHMKEVDGDEGRWMRGFYYARDPLPNWAVVKDGEYLSVHTPERFRTPGTVLFKHLDGPWYLYLYEHPYPPDND